MAVKTWTKNLIVVCLTTAILYYLYAKHDISATFRILVGVNPYIILLTIALSFLIMIIRAERWRLLLSSMNLHLSLKESYHISMASVPFWLVSPSTSGDLVKSYYLKDRMKMATTAGTVISENIFDLACLAILAGIGSIFYFNPVNAILSALIIISSVIFMLLTVWKPKKIAASVLWRKISAVLKPLENSVRNPSLFLKLSAITMVNWIISMAQIYLFFKALEVNVPFFFTIANIQAAILAGMIPITLGGMGTRDAAIVALFSGYASPGTLLGIGILFTAIRIGVLAAAGVFHMLWFHLRR